MLTHGRSSPRARHFDIDWQAGDGRVILPVLGESYGVALASGAPLMAGLIAGVIGGIVGVIGLAFALVTLLRPAPADAPPPAADWGRGTFWGLLTGYTSFVSHSGAPPYQIYVQPLRLGKETYAGTVTVFFAVVNAVKLIPYAALGQLGVGNLGKAAAMIPVAAASVFAGVWLVRRIPHRSFFLFITWALLLVSLKLIWDALR